jgi:hypothetical protein
LLTGIAAFMGLINLPFLVLFASALGIFYFLIFIRDKDQVFAFGTLSLLPWCFGLYWVARDY